MRPFKDPPAHVPTYDGEISAIADVEAHGWTVYHHNTGFDHFDSSIAVHPTNPASPMMLTAWEHMVDGRSTLTWWWRPMDRVPHWPLKWNQKRINLHLPRLSRSRYQRERVS